MGEDLVSDLVFVYGTLRKGEVNHHLLKGAEYLGEHTTLPRYRMLDLGAYPGLVEAGYTAIVGEVYRINLKQLILLDRLEDYPRLYDRKLIASPWGKSWIYIYRGRWADRRIIKGGDWRSFTNRSGPFRVIWRPVR